MPNPPRRFSPLGTLSVAFISILQLALAESKSKSANVITIDARRRVPALESGYLRMGGKSSSGHEIQVNSRYLTLDGKPWLPVMGEFHFSRYPEKYREEEILEMKAGGIQIISTYIFWIHHEEVEGQFDGTGERDLHHFAELCGKYGMYMFARVGPRVHGEARNGGFPDWLLQKGTNSKKRPYLPLPRPALLWRNWQALRRNTKSACKFGNRGRTSCKIKTEGGGLYPDEINSGCCAETCTNTIAG